jgi:hypothetical protein
MNFRSIKAGNFLTSELTINFSRRTLHHELIIIIIVIKKFNLKQKFGTVLLSGTREIWQRSWGGRLKGRTVVTWNDGAYIGEK